VSTAITASENGLDLGELKLRIANLTPDFEAQATFRERIDLLGFNVDCLKGSRQISRGRNSRQQTHPVCSVKQGTWVPVELFLRSREALVIEELSPILVLNGKRAAFRKLDVGSWQIGGVYKESIALAVPLGGTLGRCVVQIGSVDDDGSIVSELRPLLTVEVEPANITDQMNERPFTMPINNLVSNWSFEEDFKEGQWQLLEHPGIEIRLDNLVAWHGSRSVRVDFYGGYDVNFHHVFQTVPLEPNSVYRLAYRIKVLGINSKSGPRVELWDKKDLNMTSTEVFGTHGWQMVENQFKTPRVIGPVDLRLRRFGAAGRHRTSEATGTIGGTVWYDCVELEKVEHE
jgi:hypothetical protein